MPAKGFSFGSNVKSNPKTYNLGRRARRPSARGEDIPAEGEAFDSNCITPGTAFMGRLNEHLRFFVRKKLAEDAAWRRPRVVLSGHEVPGEGEHKIMEYIRLAKREPGYKPNMRHCMCAPPAAQESISDSEQRAGRSFLVEGAQYDGMHAAESHAVSACGFLLD